MVEVCGTTGADGVLLKQEGDVKTPSGCKAFLNIADVRYAYRGTDPAGTCPPGETSLPLPGHAGMLCLLAVCPALCLLSTNVHAPSSSLTPPFAACGESPVITTNSYCVYCDTGRNKMTCLTPGGAVCMTSYIEPTTKVRGQ